MALKVITVKRFDDFHGDAGEEWSNGYHFSGSAPADAAAWDTFLRAIVTAERGLVNNKSKYVTAYGYDDHTGVATRRLDLQPDNIRGGRGTNGTSDIGAPPEMCTLVKYRAGNTSAGKPRYVMKWYHSAVTGTAADGKLLSNAGLQGSADTMRDGTLPGGRKLCTPSGTECGVAVIHPYLFSRDLKRRGKRPTSG